MVLGKNFQKTEDFGGKGVGRSEGMKDKCKVGSLNIFCIQTTYLPLLNIGSIALATEICAGSHHRLLRRQHCSSLCSQSEGHEHVANMVSALAHDFVRFLAVFGRHNIRPPSLCEQSELQCFAAEFRRMFALRLLLQRRNCHVIWLKTAQRLFWILNTLIT